MENLQALNDFIEDHTSKVDELKIEIERLKWEKDLASRSWQLSNSEQIEVNYKSKLPLPRLEMRIIDDGCSRYWVYGLVCKRYESFEDTISFIPFNRTRTTASFESIHRTMDLPFRDGTHIVADAVQLKLKAFLVCDAVKKVKEIDINNERIKEVVRCRMMQ